MVKIRLVVKIEGIEKIIYDYMYLFLWYYINRINGKLLKLFLNFVYFEYLVYVSFD